jgi:hypothetical protein
MGCGSSATGIQLVPRNHPAGLKTPPQNTHRCLCVRMLTETCSDERRGVYWKLCQQQVQLPQPECNLVMREISPKLLQACQVWRHTCLNGSGTIGSSDGKCSLVPTLSRRNKSAAHVLYASSSRLAADTLQHSRGNSNKTANGGKAQNCAGPTCIACAHWQVTASPTVKLSLLSVHAGLQGCCAHAYATLPYMQGRGAASTRDARLTGVLQMQSARTGLHLCFNIWRRSRSYQQAWHLTHQSAYILD